jgi:hypothetical protein
VGVESGVDSTRVESSLLQEFNGLFWSQASLAENRSGVPFLIPQRSGTVRRRYEGSTLRRSNRFAL